MRYLPGLPDHEGSVYDPGSNRSGARTPMQWAADLPNAGFSTASTDQLYLPQDPSPDRPTVRAQMTDSQSVLHQVQRLVQLRRRTPLLGPAASTQVLTRNYPFVYTRGDRLLIVINPRRERATASPAELHGRITHPVEVNGVHIQDGVIEAAGFGYGVYGITR